MGQSIAEWETFFEQLSPEFREEVIKAIETLQKAELVFKEYEWTGLFTLAKIAKSVRNPCDVINCSYWDGKECRRVDEGVCPLEDGLDAEEVRNGDL